MTMFQNWSTKDEIETSIRTFQSVRDEIETHFLKLNKEMTKMGGKTYRMLVILIQFQFNSTLSNFCFQQNTNKQDM